MEEIWVRVWDWGEAERYELGGDLDGLGPFFSD